MPVHIGLPTAGRVDVVVSPKQKGLSVARVTNVDPARQANRVLVVTVGR
jgi:hypothetical protein